MTTDRALLLSEDRWTPGAAGSYDVARNALRPFTARRAAFAAVADSPRHFLERCLARIAACEPDVRAFTALDLPGARIMADDASVRWRAGRPLSAIDGMPVGIKDIIETADLPTQMNSPIFEGFQARRDAACVVTLKAAGAVILGKTVTTEFACGRSGPTRNPHDLARTPGGSSSGSAAAVGAGMLPGALGTQTQASVIRPASYCGAYAFKPSHGWTPFDGCAPLGRSLDTLGVFGASLEDCWAMAAVLGGGGPDLFGPRMPWPTALPTPLKPRRLVRLDTVGWQETDATSQAAFDAMLAFLATSDVEIIDRHGSAEVAALEAVLCQVPDASLRIFAYESAWPLRSYTARSARMVGERIHELLALAADMTERDYLDAVALRQDLCARVAALSRQSDGFVMLASSGPAIADISYTGSRSYPVPWSLVGGPSLALPLMISDGLPLGLQIAGAPATEHALASVAAWLCRHRLALMPNVIDSTGSA